jgi:hypothetical protein
VQSPTFHLVKKSQDKSMNENCFLRFEKKKKKKKKKEGKSMAAGGEATPGGCRESSAQCPPGFSGLLIPDNIHC